jgi:hypothetical protein
MIDFAIHIEPSNNLNGLIQAHGRSKQEMSISHTLYNPLRRRPIGVNIETKRTGEDFRDAQYKLQIWCAAQFAKMEELVNERQRQMSLSNQGEPDHGSELEPPFLPGIIIQGHDWSFVAAVRNTSKKETVSKLYLFLEFLRLSK